MAGKRKKSNDTVTPPSSTGGATSSANDGDRKPAARRPRQQQTAPANPAGSHRGARTTVATAAASTTTAAARGTALPRNNRSNKHAAVRHRKGPPEYGRMPTTFAAASTATAAAWVASSSMLGVTLNLIGVALPSTVATTTQTVQKKDSRKRPPCRPPSPETVPMRAQKITSTMMDLDSLDDPLRRALAPQRTRFLMAILPLPSVNKTDKWRVQYERQNRDNQALSSLQQSTWNMLVACVKAHDCQTIRDPIDYETLEATMGSKSLAEWLVRQLKAHFSKARFDERLKSIDPLQEDSPDGMDCPVCCERYELSDMVFCAADHSFCKICLNQYVTTTLEVGGLDTVSCMNTQTCSAIFPFSVVKSCVSEWDRMRIQEREEARNTKVALAAKAVLSCKCGAVGIIEDLESLNNGRVECPGCPLVFCAKCGNEYHTKGTKCPPPKKTLEWISKHTRLCPNCHTPIEKNGGCNHMYCCPPKGCGHHFQYDQAKRL